MQILQNSSGIMIWASDLSDPPHETYVKIGAQKTRFVSHGKKVHEIETPQDKGYEEYTIGELRDLWYELEEKSGIYRSYQLPCWDDNRLRLTD